MASIVCFEELLEIPAINSLEEFRRWVLSDELPERGRIDYISGRIEVDMSPKELFTYGTLKGEQVRHLGNRIKRHDSGLLLTAKSRISSPVADLSVTPDVLFVSYESLAERRVQLIPKPGAGPGRYVEMEGAADLIVEIVSDECVVKDTRRLPEAYYRAGVQEFWLVDARGPELEFQIYHRGEKGFKPAGATDGFQPSTVFTCSFRLDRQPDRLWHWEYDLREKTVN